MTRRDTDKRNPDRAAALRRSTGGRGAVVAVGLGALVALTGCGQDAPQSASSAPTQVTVASSSPQASSSTSSSSTSSASSEATPTKTASATSSREAASTPGTSAQSGAATQVKNVWPDSSWNIEQGPDGCVPLGPSPSPMAKAAGYFTCGSNAMGLMACKAKGNHVTCIQSFDPHGRKNAASFTTTADVSGPFPGTPDAPPLAVELSDGEVCTLTQHDQMPHYPGKSGWLYCGSEVEPARTLFVKNTDAGSAGGYFDKSNPAWTVEYGVGTNAPVTKTVKTVYYVG